MRLANMPLLLYVNPSKCFGRHYGRPFLHSRTQRMVRRLLQGEFQLFSHFSIAKVSYGRIVWVFKGNPAASRSIEENFLESADHFDIPLFDSLLTESFKRNITGG